MKLLKIISVGVLAGYCYKKLKAKKKQANHLNHQSAEEGAVP